MLVTTFIAILCIVILSLLFTPFYAPITRSLTPLQLRETTNRRHEHRDHRPDGHNIDHHPSSSSVDSVSLVHTNTLLNEWSATESHRIRQMIYFIIQTFDDVMSDNTHSPKLCHQYANDKKHGGTLYYDDVYQVYWTGGSNSDAKIVTALRPDDCDVCAADTVDVAADDNMALPSSTTVIKTECRSLCNDEATVRRCWICQRLESGLTLDTGITVEHTTNLQPKQIDHIDKIMSSMFSQVEDISDTNSNTHDVHTDDQHNADDTTTKHSIVTHPALFFQSLQSDYYQVGRIIQTLFARPQEMNALYPYHFTQEAIASNDHSIQQNNNNDNAATSSSTTHSHLTYESQPVTSDTPANRPTLQSESSPFDMHQPYAINSDAVTSFLSRLHPRWFESIDGGGGGGGGMGYQLICSEEHVIIDSVDIIRTSTLLTTGGGGGAGYRLHGNSRDSASSPSTSPSSGDSDDKVAAGVLLPPSTSQSFAPRYAQMKFNGGAGTGAGLQLSTMRDDANDHDLQLNVGGGGGGGLTFEVRSVDPVDPDYKDNDGEEYAERDGTVEVNNIVYEFGSTPDDSIVLPSSEQLSVVPSAIAKRMRLCLNRGGALHIQGGGGGGGGQHYHLHLTDTTTTTEVSSHHKRLTPRVNVFTHSALGFHFDYLYHRRSSSSSYHRFCVSARPFPDRNVVEKRIQRTVNEASNGESGDDAVIRAKYQRLAADEATLGFYGAEVAQLITKCLQRSRTSSSSASLPSAGSDETSEASNYYTQTLCPCLRDSFRTVLKKHSKKHQSNAADDSQHNSKKHRHHQHVDSDADSDSEDATKDPSEYNNPFMNCRAPPKRPDRTSQS